jgi:hypothetical protein
MPTNALPRVVFDTNEGAHAHGNLLNLPFSSRTWLQSVTCTKRGSAAAHADEMEPRVRVRPMTPAERADWCVFNDTWVAEPIPSIVLYRG